MQMLKINISKREELVIISALLSILMLVLFFVPLGLWKFIFLIFMGVCVYLASIFILRGYLAKIEYVVLPILPILFTLSFALFYNIIPERWLTRLIFISIYGSLIYSVLLIENVFNVAKTKNIQLLRVARTIYFFVSSFTVFLFSYVLLSFHLFGLFTGLIFLVFVFFISYTFFWSFRLEKAVRREDIFLSMSSAMILFELMFVFSFWPLNIYLISLLLTSVYYSILGIWDNLLSFRLKGWGVQEYILINFAVFVLGLLIVNFG